MKNLFSLDNPFIQLLSRVGDMIIVKFLCLLCSLPIITAGAAISASHRIMQDIVLDNEGSIFKTFFRVFKENFKQSTLVWIMELIILVSLACDAFLVFNFFPGSKVMYVLLAVLAFLVLCVCAHMIPLLIRYQNGLRQHLSNAMVLAVIRLPRTVAMVVMSALPLIVLVLDINVFLQTLVFWLFIGFAFIAYMNMFLYKGIYGKLEAGKK